MVPAALEMMDQLCVRAVEEYIHAGLPVDAAAVLLVEVAGLAARARARRRSGSSTSPSAHGCGTVRIAQDEAERALLWKGRKTAFGAIARIKPNYYLHDTVVPRRHLPEVLRQVYEIAERHGILVMNVFHAGDGNLHPLLVFDKREPGMMDRVHAAGEEIVAGVGRGRRRAQRRARHRPGEARPDAADVRARPTSPRRPRCAARSTPPGLANPTKVLPSPAGVRRRPSTCPRRAVDLSRRSPTQVGTDGPVTITGLATRGGAGAGRALRRARPRGIEWIQADEMTVSCGAGTPVDELAAALAEVGQRAVLPAGGTVGGALAVGRSGIRRLGDGPVRDVLLQARYVGADGEVVKAGGPTVKNVSGFDVCRLLVGSRGHARLPRRRDPPHPPDRAALAVVRRPHRRSRPSVRVAAPPGVGAVGRRVGVGAARGPSGRRRRRRLQVAGSSRPTAARRCRRTAHVVAPSEQLAIGRRLARRVVRRRAGRRRHARRRRCVRSSTARSTRRSPRAGAGQAPVRSRRTPEPRRRRWLSNRSSSSRRATAAPRSTRLAAAAAEQWSLPEPDLMRTGMNALFAAGDDVVLRIGRPTADPAAAIWLAELLRDAGIRVPRYPRPEPLTVGELTVFAIEREHPLSDRSTGARSAAWWRVLHTIDPSTVAGRYPAPWCSSFPWWDFDRCSDEVGDLLDADARRRASSAALERQRGRGATAVDRVVLCHGDVHPGNVLQTDDGPMLIDWDLLCREPTAWDHAPMMTWTERWGGEPGVYEAFADGYGPSLRGDPFAEAFAELRLVAATLMRVRAGRTDPGRRRGRAPAALVARRSRRPGRGARM